MPAGLLTLYSIAFFISLWLGFYLLARDLRKRSLLLTGYGLGFYAAAIYFEVLKITSPQPLIPIFAAISNIFIKSRNQPNLAMAGSAPDFYCCDDPWDFWDFTHNIVGDCPPSSGECIFFPPPFTP
jgi:hypothetical protein